LIFWILLAGHFITQFADEWTTWLGIDLGAVEVHPTSRWIMRHRILSHITKALGALGIAGIAIALYLFYAEIGYLFLGVMMIVYSRRVYKNYQVIKSLR